MIKINNIERKGNKDGVESDSLEKEEEEEMGDDFVEIEIEIEVEGDFAGTEGDFVEKNFVENESAEGDILGTGDAEGGILGRNEARPSNPFRRKSTRAADSSRSMENVSKKSKREERIERTCWSTSIEAVIISCTWPSSTTSSMSSLGRLWPEEGPAESKESGFCGSKAAV